MENGMNYIYQKKTGVPTGIRTPVASVKGRCPRPLDDGDLRNTAKFTTTIFYYNLMKLFKKFYLKTNFIKLLVEVSGIEPLTSCMPCKRSPS